MKQQTILLPTELKTCRTCCQQKPASEFNSNPRTRDRLQTECRECQKKRYKIWRSQEKLVPKPIPEKSVCRQCHLEKPGTDFSRDIYHPDGIHPVCKDCTSANRRKNLLKHPYPVSVESQQCRVCKQVKPASDFGRDARSRSGLRTDCKACNAKQGTDKYQSSEERREQQHRATIMQKYGLPPQDYDSMFEKQFGVCAICGNPETAIIRGSKSRLSVDHDHRPGGKVRALLCHRCNYTLGFVRDDVSLLQKMIDYLNRFAPN